MRIADWIANWIANWIVDWCALNPQSSPQPATRNPQPAIRSPQSAARNPQPAIRSPQSAARNPQSAIRNPQYYWRIRVESQHGTVSTVVRSASGDAVACGLTIQQTRSS